MNNDISDENGNDNNDNTTKQEHSNKVEIATTSTKQELNNEVETVTSTSTGCLAAIYLLLFIPIFFLILPFIIHIPSEIFLGWPRYIYRVCSQIQMNYELLMQGIICFIFVAIGIHVFCSWIYRHKQQNITKIWKKTWSFACIFIVMILFVTGMATTGIIEQMSWLPEQKIYRSFYASHSKLKSIEKRTISDILNGPRKEKLNFFLLLGMTMYMTASTLLLSNIISRQ